MLSHIITLTTDFGLLDPYVAEMKAVILTINPEAKIIDVTHQIEKFNIRMAAFILSAAAPYFPKNTVHVGVVDPGVGTGRKPILIETRRSFFVGPDNGILVLAAKKEGIRHIYEISSKSVMLDKVSQTFHGRDVFAPAAAHLSMGFPPSKVGPEIHKIVAPEFAKIVRNKSAIIGEILHVDGFGNIITNIDEKDLKQAGVRGEIDIEFAESRMRLKLCKAYAEVKLRQPLAIIGSHGFLEISVNQGNAAEIFHVKAGDKVTIYRSS